MAEWDPKQGGHRQAYTVKTWNCPGCRLTKETYASAIRDNPHLHGIKVRLEPTIYHPLLKPSSEHMGKVT